MAEIYVTSTADSGAGSLRQAIANAQAGDVILFDSTVFPVGQTTAIYLSSYLTVNKSVSIYGGESDGQGGYTSGATITRYVKREIEGVETEVVVDEEHPALEGETVLLRVTTRVALDGQATQDPNAADDWDGWTGSRILYVVSATNVDVETTISGITFQNGLCTASEYSAVWGTAPTSSELHARFEDCKVANCVNSNGYGGGVTLRSLNVASYTFVRCEFRDCKAKSNAGCFYTRDNASASFDSCTFTSNSATNYGGGVSSYGTSQNTFDSCTFTSNSANYGGGVSSTNTSQNTFDSCTFTSNSANYGGGVYSYLLSDIRLKGTTLFEDCEAATGSAIYNVSLYYIDDSDVTYNNCSLTNAVSPDSVQTRYFTNTADSGDGSFRATLAACNNGDTIEPDPTVFEKGSIVTIKTSSPLALNRRFYLRGAGRRIVFDAQGDHAVVSSSSAYALDAEDVDFINGATTGNAGTAFQGSTTQAVKLKRCTIAGCRGYRVIHSGSSLGFAIESSVIAGNFATDTSTFTNIFIAATGSTVTGNYIASGSTTANASYFRNIGSVVQPLPSEAGFVVAPPDALAAENWDADLWRDWDLSLTSESPYATTTEDWSEETKRWAPDGEWRYDLLGLPRKDEGAAGAYERYEINYYQGDEAEKFDSPSGWFLDRLHTTPATAIRSDATFYLDRAMTFDGAPGTSQSLVVGMNTEIIIGAEESAVSMNYAVLGLNASLTSPELEINAVTISEESLLEITSGAPTLGVLDVYGVGALDYNMDDLDGDFLFVGEVEIRNGASVNNTGAGLVSIPSDAEDTTFLSPEYAIRRGAGLSAVSGTISGATLKPVPTVAHEGVGDILYEARSVDSSGAYQKLGKNDNLNAINAETAVTVRAFDGENFATATVPRTYYYVGGSVGSFIQPADWSLVRNGTALNVAPTVKGCRFIVGDISSGE